MHNVAKALFVSLLAVSTSFALPQNPPAQQKPESPEATTVIRTTTRLVVVNVVAKNSKGQPVADLKSEDFTVLENGRPQQVKVFNFQSRTNAAIKAAQPVEAPVSDVVTNIPKYHTNGALNIILLDGLNTASPRQTFMRERMIALLEKLPDDVPIAIYTLGQNLRLIQDFTDNHETLKKVVNNLHNNLSNTMQSPSGGPALTLPGVFAAQLPAAARRPWVHHQRLGDVRTHFVAVFRSGARSDQTALRG